MSINEEPIATRVDETPVVNPGNHIPSWQYQTLHLEDTIGAVFLGIFAMIFLVGWRRAESRNRQLMNQLRG